MDVTNDSVVTAPQWVRELHPKLDEKCKQYQIDSYTRIAVDYNGETLARECYNVTLNGQSAQMWAVYYHSSNPAGLLSYTLKISIHL